MTAGITRPQAYSIIQSIIDSLLLTKKYVGQTDGFHYAPDLAVEAPGVSPKWFDNPDWGMAYWVVAPEERITEKTGFRFTARMEVFVVGAKSGQWSVDPIAAAKKKPTRREVQEEIKADIIKALTSPLAFRRPDPDNVGGNLATNTEPTTFKMSFTAYPNFAIVSSRWEVEYEGLVERP